MPEKTYKQYMADLPSVRRKRLARLIAAISKWFPKASLTMKYNMPTFELGENWVALANMKNYISVYTCSPHHISHYTGRHPEVKFGKGCLNFRDGDEIHMKDLKKTVKSALKSKDAIS